MAPRYGEGKGPHQGLDAIISQGRQVYIQFIDVILSLSSNLYQINKQDNEANQLLPTWNNGFLPGLDIAALYAMIASRKPTKYIEVGSGNSTKVVAKAIKDFELKTQITSIDPFPRAEIDGLVTEVIRMPFENTNVDWAQQLDAGDVLFIDNSHRILPNSDAMVFFMEVLPVLKSGVIVHIHDVYLPYDYPQNMCDRFYSEQYGLAFYLLANPERYKTIFPCYYVSEDKELSDRLSSFWQNKNVEGVEKHGGSYWLEIGKF